MKKTLLFLFVLVSFSVFSQVITVNTTTHTVPQLVTDVLVDSDCVSISNISWRTGTSFGSVNGIGYFENTSPNFPLQSGVILSTGNVLNAPGPNTTQLDDGTTSWTGDADLEATLLASGITMNSVNATVLEFDFVPFSSNFDFRFLFASEEYGNFQCQFSDAFAFLLTNTATGVTTNLAVVPGTTTPISVVTIRDNLYNSSCSSENSSYFGAFNGGSAAAGSATNFNGQTVVLSASSSTLVANTTYHIKLVIADRQDYKADSAIFLGANSFNIGQDVLGTDLTVATNTAICSNQSYTITSGLDPAIYSFKWKLDGNTIGGNTPDLTINQPGSYSLTYTIIASNCEVTTDTIIVEYYTPLTTPDPIDLYKCDSGLTSYTYDLSINTPIVGVFGTQISYHESQLDAEGNINPLTNSHTVLSTNLPKTIWIRIVDMNTACISTKSFELKLTPPPTANSPADMRSCETGTNTDTANFDLNSQTSSVLGSQSASVYSVFYYASQADADANTNAIDLSSDYVSGNDRIYVRVETTTDPNCYSTTNFELIVTPNPILDDIEDQYVCTSFTLPILVNPGDYYSGPNQGLPMLHAGDVITTDSTIYIYYATATTPSCVSEANFRVEIVTPTDITPADVNACDTYTLPGMSYDTKYYTQPGGSTGTGTEIPAGTVITTPGTTTIYTYFVSTDTPTCILESQFNITITITPTITGNFPNVFDCISYNLPPLAVGDYYTYDSATSTYTLATSPITSTTTLYVYATNGICKSPDRIFTVYIGSLGISDVNVCLPYNLPPAPVGEYRDAPNGGGNIIAPGLISQSITVYTYVPNAGTPNCTDNDFFTITINAPFLSTPTPVSSCENYTIPIQAEGGNYYTLSGGPSTSGNTEIVPNTIITSSTTIYIYKPSTTMFGCYNEKPWTITINQKPVIDSRANVEVCDSYTLTALINGNYFDNQNGVNPLSAGDIITSDNRIYIYAAHPDDASCYSENYFDISINGVEAEPIPTILTYCDSFTFPPHTLANNYYYDAPNGPHGSGNIIPAGTVITSANLLPIYYIYYETGDRLNCSDENTFSITINHTPIANTPNALVACDNYLTNDGIFLFNLTNSESDVLGSQTPASNYSFTYYTTFAEANNPLGIAIVNPTAYENSNPYIDSVWVRISDNSNVPINSCFAVTELKLRINPLPNPLLEPEYFICEDYETGTLLNFVTLNTTLSSADYDFSWLHDGVPFGGNTSFVNTNLIGNYTVEVTDKLTLCKNIDTTIVTKYSPYLEIQYSDAFDEATYITVLVQGNGSGNYEYQIDGGTFQDSNVFSNVSPGEHIIAVRDKNGYCSPAPVKAAIVNYPKFFTPNGDGYNDTWNILHLKKVDLNAPISIFDRFGKFIKQITPSTSGWDGMLNGKPLPATDYWFKVDYLEKGSTKTYRSHFALKR